MQYLKTIIPALVTLAGSILLTACGGSAGGGVNTTASKAAALSGTAYGGRQPIIGSTVTVYEAGLSPGQTATQIGQTTTDAHGSFNIAAFSPTPANGQLVYVVAQGGDAGGGVNAVVRLMTVAGAYCDSSTAGCSFPDTVNVNELSTVAATAALQHQITVPPCSMIVGNTNTGNCVSIPGATGLAQRAGTFNALVNPVIGRLSGFLAASANGAPVALTARKLNSLADLLATCVNSQGGSSGDGSACGNLFQQAGAAPETLAAALQIASSPVYNASGAALYALLSSPLIFTPAVTQAPSDWTIAGQRHSLLASASGLGGYSVNAITGALAPVPGAIATAQKVAAVDPLGRFAYFADSDNHLSLATIDPATGALTAIATATVDLSADAGTAGLSVDPSGRFLYVAEQGSGVLVYTINQADGTLTPVSGSPFAVDAAAVAVTVDPSGRFAYVAGDGATISAYSINAATGVLTPVTGSPFTVAGATGLHAMAVDPSGRFIYAADQQAGQLAAYGIDQSTGALTPVSGTPFTTGGAPDSVTVDPSGRFVYTGNATDDTVTGYALDATSGALTTIPGSPFPAGTGAQPVSIGIDPGGSFAYVALASANVVQTYAIDPTTGALSAPADGSVVVDVGQVYATALAADPNGRFTYAIDSNLNTILGYARDPVSGAQIPVPGSPFAGPSGTVSTSLTIDPSGRFLLAPDYANGMTVYAIDAGSGALTMIDGSPFVLNAGSPVGVTFDSTGRYVYSFNNANSISGFSIDPVTGALTGIPGLPIGTDQYPQDGVTDPVGPFIYVSTSQNGVTDGYVIDPSTGAFSSVIAGVPYHFYCDAMRITPDGHYLYCATSYQGITVYGIDPGTGVLTALAPAGSPYGHDSAPQKLVIDPSGRFLYTADAQTASAYAIGSDGALTPAPGSPYTLSSHNNDGPLDLTIDSSGGFVYVNELLTSSYISETLAYSVDPDSGALTPVNVPSSIAVSGSPSAFVAGP